MRSIEAITADGSKSPSGMAYTVLRIRMGGSAGLRMMIAFPCCAPPITARAVDVVSVNSSIFCLVPGPAERLADRTDHLGVPHGSDTAHGVDHRCRCLPATGNH